MSQLWLNFRDENGVDRRVPVDAGSFTVGRQPGNGLAIPDNRLSRTHLKIDRFGEVFVASDCGSSNGTTHNGSKLDKPVSLANGDCLVLGGGIEIEVELIAAAVEPRRQRRTMTSETADSGDGSSIPPVIFIAAPVLVIIILVCGGGLVYFVGEKKDRDVVILNDTPIPERTTTDDDPPESDPSPTPTATPAENQNGSVTPSPTSSVVSDETRRIGEHAAKFLRRIALSDPNAFLNSAQIEILKGRVASLRGSSALGANLKQVSGNASEFRSMASAQALKPDFLAAAALAKLGNKPGDPVSTAKTMLPFLGDLRISLGNSLADDNLLIMADYLRRERNVKGSLQGILEGIPRSKIGGADPREIRTIWFLRKNNKISEEAYDFALRFLAIGTIMQNPKDFDVNAEPVNF
ncbi:MAG: FHA domain-containing protein [Acidobacteria bacterium]|nr:FHA domain-containing protein [Acidobacteriota bacterium]